MSASLTYEDERKTLPTIWFIEDIWRLFAFKIFYYN